MRKFTGLKLLGLAALLQMQLVSGAGAFPINDNLPPFLPPNLFTGPHAPSIYDSGRQQPEPPYQPSAYDQTVWADFVNDGDPSQTWTFSDSRLHCAQSSSCRKVIDTIRIPRGYYACRASANAGDIAWINSPMRIIVNVARGRGGFDYYADPYRATAPIALHVELTLRPRGTSAAGCMKTSPTFDCQSYACRAAQPGGLEWK